MMRIKVDTEGPYEPGTVYLRLVETDPNHVMLEAFYDYGDMVAEEDIFLPGGGLLTITAEGRVSLSPRVDPELGFELDHDGRLKLDEYTEAQTAKRGAFRRGRARLVENDRIGEK